MKPKNFKLIMIMSLSFFILSLCSCWIDDSLNPPEDRYDPEVVFDQSSSDTTKPVRYPTDELSWLQSSPDNDQWPEQNTTYESALESLEFDGHPDWGVAIKANRCIYNGQTLLVYNPNDSDINFYDSKRFGVYWFKDGKPIRSTQNRLACVCKGKYAVIVIHRPTLKGIGLDFYNGRACLADEVAAPTTDN